MTVLPTRTLAIALVLAVGCRAGGSLEIENKLVKHDTQDTAVPEDTAPEDTGPEDTGPVDADEDGFPAAEDCDDNNPEIHPGAEEACNGIDDDCDGDVDEEVADAPQWFADVDNDGHGDDLVTQTACEPPSGFVPTGGDCDDRDAAFYPGAPEDDCTDPADYNCDGSVGWADDDGDGWAACLECDDQERTVNPSAIEVCDGVDNDCDGTVDGPGSVDATPWYADTDSDGYGDAANAVLDCTAPSGRVGDDSDCDDTNGAVSPSATEFCNSIDDDCDGTIDEPDSADASTWYLDVDGDGHGNASFPFTACAAPSGTVAADDDCDDTDANVSPSAQEVCNGIDDDCDGDVDSTATDQSTWYLDGDCDGEAGSTSQLACAAPSSSWMATSTDCDDADPLVGTTLEETCDGLDNDCDGAVDESCFNSQVIPAPSHAAVTNPALEAACAEVGEMSAVANSHSIADLPVYMAVLDGTSSGLAESTQMATDWMDWSIRYGANYTASPGNFSPSTPWPTFTNQGNHGAARFRGYLNIGCNESLHRTIGLLGNDALSLTIEGLEIVTVNWSDGRWKKFRYITFPEPGLYAFEIQWSTNLISTIDPFEWVWAEGFLSGYDALDTLCYFSTCTYGVGVPIPGFSVVEGSHLVQAADGSATACETCASDADCTASCNSAGICE